MPKASAIMLNRATRRSGALCSELAASVRLTIALSEMAKRIFAKPYRALVDILEVSERDAHYRISASRKYTASDVAKLLQSEEGIHFLVVLMEGQRPKWWKAVLRMGMLGSIEERRKSEIELMKRVFDADEVAGKTFSDSFCAQDPNFYRAVLEGYDVLSALGSVGGAVDATKRKR